MINIKRFCRKFTKIILKISVLHQVLNLKIETEDPVYIAEIATYSIYLYICMYTIYFLLRENK